MAKLSFLLLILFCVEASAQNIVEGTIVSKTTGKPIPYVNIYLKGVSLRGTISNQQGKFRFRVPEKTDSIIFSHVSFKRRSFTPTFFSSSREIQLEEVEKLLTEVVIMPDSSLRQMLRKAFKKIEKNYPATGSLVEGFYRETNKLTDDNEFIYFSESMIQFFKPSYSNRNYGPVKIIEGAKSEVKSRQEFSNISYYAGVYAPQNMDIAKQRIEFINPSSFNLYDYSIENIIKEGDREILNISFKPKFESKNRANFTGHFQLDKKSLAYTSTQFDLTPIGLKNHNRSILLNIKDTQIHYEVKYAEENGRWNLITTVYDGEVYNPKYKNLLRHTSEFVTTSIKLTDENPIKDSEAISYTAIYTDQVSKFSDDYWKKDEVIARDSVLEKQVKLLFDKKEVALKKSSEALKGPNLRPVLGDHIKVYNPPKVRLNSTLSFGVVPITHHGGLLSANYGNKISTQAQVDNSSYLLFYDTDIGYRFHRSFNAFLSIAASASKSKEFGNVRLGVNYRKRLFGWKLPVHFEGGLSVGTFVIMQTLGQATSLEDFTLNKKKFSAGKSIEMLVGRKSTGVFPSLQLDFSVRPRLQLFTGVTFFSPISTQDKLVMTQKKNFLFSSRASTSLDDPNVGLKINGEAQRTSPLTLRDFPTMFRIGLVMSVD